MTDASMVQHRAKSETPQRPAAQGSRPVVESRPVPRLSSSVSLVLLCVLTITWALLMGRFDEGGVYWTMGVYALAVTCVVGPAFDTLLRELLKPSLRDVALGLGVGAAMTAATYPAYRLASSWFPALQGHVAELYADSRQESLAVALLWVVIILVVEELLWRAAWIEALRAYVDPRLAAVLSVGLYALAQLGSGSWIVALLALCCGGVWTLLRMWSHSLWPPLLAHLVWTPVVILICPIA